MDNNIRLNNIDFKKSSTEINVGKGKPRSYNSSSLPLVDKKVIEKDKSVISSAANVKSISSDNYLNQVFNEVNQIYELAKSIKLNYNLDNKTSKVRVKNFPTPDFTDLANAEFKNTLSPQHLKATQAGIKLYLSQAGKDHFSRKYLSSDNNLNTYSKILNMGIRDEESFYNYINTDISDNKVTRDPFERSLKAFDKGKAYFKAHDRERAFYYLGNSLYHIQKSDWQNADKNTAHVLGEFFSSVKD